MPITFTEEDFQSAPAQPKAGFFSEQDFAPRVKKTPEQLLQVVNAAQAARDVVNPPETQGFLGQVAANPITQNVVSGLSLQPAMHAVGTVASIIPNIVANELYGPRPQPFVINRDSGEMTQPPGVDPYFAAGKPMLNIPLAHPEQSGINDVSALPRVLAQMAEGMTSPENATLLPLAANKQVGSQIASTLFAPQMIAGGLQSAPQIVSGETPQAREEAAYNTALNLLLGAGVGKGLVDRYKAQPIVPEVMPPLQRPVAPASRQLNAPALPFTDAELATPKQLPAPGERPTMPVGSPLDRPAGGARFGVDPSGKAVDISQLSPKEQVELYRGPNQYVPREQYVRPAQQAPVIIGEQPKPKREVVFQNETQPIQPIYVPGKSPVEPSGGEISFRAPAEAKGVPSARQSAVEPVAQPKPEVAFQNETAPAAEPAKPVVAKTSTSQLKNPLGDPMGTTYHATPEDWTSWQKVQTEFKDLLAKGAEFDGPEMMKVRQENETIKNRYGGMPPQPPKGGGIGGGVKGAVEKNKEAGSVENPFPGIVEKFKKREEEKRGETFALSGPRIALDPKESGFKDVTKKVDAQQLWNRVKNKLTPAERDIYEKAGVDKKIVEMGKVSPEEAAQMLQENGVEVRTHSYGMEGKVSEAKREYDKMTHEWYDGLSDEAKDVVDNALEDGRVDQSNLATLPTDVQKEVQKYLKLEKQVKREPRDASPRATSAYETVSPFPVNEPMPEWTKSRDGKNVQRVDVVVPPKPGYQSKAEQMSGDNWKTKEQTGVLWQPDNLHENLPNTLGWAMIQYKDGPKGEKIAVIVEAQSRWGQKLREDKQWLERNKAKGQEVAINTADHPLLRDYNRLILKAAIDQARKEGATHIVVSDAESAMMTEGHDAHTANEVRQGFLMRPEIAQEPGMRLNYDTILPKIMEELSGEKGERVSLGEHKNAFEKDTSGPRQPYSPGAFQAMPDKPRSNLIFRNPDGTPKTDVSGTMYKIPQTDKKFSLFEKDRPESVAGRLYLNPVGPMAKQAVKDIKKLGNGVKETSAKLKEYFKGASDKVLPDLVFQNNNPLPDFQPKEIANKIFSQPFGSEKIPVLGRAMGGKARLRTPQDDAVATWYAERHGVASAVASSVGEQIRGQIKGAFKVSENGDLNVRALKPGLSLKMSDVFEGLRRDPLSYDLTLEQRRVYKNIIEPITKRMTELANKYGIIDEVVDENGDLRPYYPRIVTKHPKIEDKKATSAFKTRAFNTEKEGWDRGYEYELDPEKRLVTGVERLYRAIANKRLATDPILGAKSESQLKAEIKQAYADRLATGEITQNKIDRIAEGIRTRGQVMQPILIRTIFDPATAKMLNREFAAEQSSVRRAITSANSLMKAMQLGFDLGVTQIQMLPLLYNNPKVWGTALYDSAKGMVNPEFFSTYVRANKEVVNELAQLGSSVGRLQEHMSGLGGESILGKVPVVGDVAQAFGRQFQTAMDVAKIELWKALREVTPKKEWPKLIRSIETVLLSGRSESAMVPHGRALLERVALLAPSYYRGAVEHIAALSESGASGKVVRQSMGRFILGSAITFYAVAKALQMSDEDIKDAYNPGSTSFMTWKVKQENGSVVNIGFGGIFRSFLKLGGNLIKTSVEHPENWKSLSSEKNPLSRWYRGHAGPTPSLMWDAFSGKDFLGRDVDVGTIAKGRLPLLAQEAMRRPEEAKVTPLDLGASMFGLTTTPESFGNRRARMQEEESKKMFGKEFKNLSPLQRGKVDKAVDAANRNVPKGMTKEKSRELAMRMSDEKVKKLEDSLPQEVKDWVSEKGVEVGGYQSTLTRGGKQVRLTKEESEKLQEKMVSAYGETLKKLMNNPNLAKKEGAELQRYVNVHLENARRKVWNKTMNEISTNARNTK